MVIDKETPTIKIDVTSDGAVEGFEDQEDGLDRKFSSSGIFLGTNPSHIDSMLERDPI